MKPLVLKAFILLFVRVNWMIPVIPIFVMDDVGDIPMVGDMLGQLRDSVPLLVQAIRSRGTESSTSATTGTDDCNEIFYEIFFHLL